MPSPSMPGCLREPKSPGLQASQGIASGRRGIARRLEEERQGRAALAERRFALEQHRRIELARLARHYRRAASFGRGFQTVGRRGQKSEVQAPGASRHGRFEPLSRSAADDLWQDRGLSRASRSRLDRSRADQSARKKTRPQENAVDRLEQVRKHARTEYLQAVFL